MFYHKICYSSALLTSAEIFLIMMSLAASFNMGLAVDFIILSKLERNEK